MSNPLTLEDLQARIMGVLPSAVEKRSALTAAGATNVAFDTDILREYTIGGASAVAETAEKPLSDLGIADHLLNEVTLVHIIVGSNQYLRTAEGSDAVDRFVAQAADSLVWSSDIVLLAGTNPADGTALDGTPDSDLIPSVDLSDVNLKENAIQVVLGTVDTVGDTPDETADEAIKRALALAPSGDYLLLSNPGFAGVAFSENGAGLPKYPLSTRDGNFPFWTASASRHEQVGLDGFSATARVTNDVLAYAGDFSRVSRAYSNISITRATEATVGGLNLFSRNLSAYRIEQTFKFAVDPDLFVAVHSE